MKNVKLLQNGAIEAQELGVDNIITLLSLILAVRVKLIKLFQKFNLLRLVDVGAEILTYGNVLNLANQAWAEFKDLKPAETKQVVAALRKNFDLPDDQEELERRIEEGLELLPQGHQLVLDNIKYISKVISFVQNDEPAIAA